MSVRGISQSRLGPNHAHIRGAMTVSPDDARAAASSLVRLLNLPAARPVQARGGLAPWQKRKIERFAKEHLAESLSIGQLADQLSLSASYFHHAFKATFGIPPHVFITKLRLESAQAMMLGTQEPLCQIAFACGFADQSHLCKIFRRNLGEAPATWRRRNRYEKEAEAKRKMGGPFPKHQADRQSLASKRSMMPFGVPLDERWPLQHLRSTSFRSVIK